MAEGDKSKVNAIEKIREDIMSCIGSKMKFRTYLGRCKVLEKEGILEEAHPNLFIIKVDGNPARKSRFSYSYVDILTKTVELSTPSGDKLFPWLN